MELAESLREIGLGAFENCTSLREIVVPEGVEELPERVFFRCHSLRKVRLPSTLKRIGREAFAFCRSLEALAIPEGVTVGERAFAGADAKGLCASELWRSDYKQSPKGAREEVP